MQWKHICNASELNCLYKHSCAMHWDFIAYDKHSCAMHWDCIAYDKHSCAMQ